MTADGRGISGALLTLTGGEQPLMVLTSPFGYYQFEGLLAGRTYLVEISSKRYQFAEPARVITVNDNVTDLDFISSGK
jgi:hypothetical protein